MNPVRMFKGIRFNEANVKLATAIAPPYDVFEDGDSVDLRLREHLHNIVHLQKPTGKTPPTRHCFFSRGYLKEDVNPGIYIYQQTWEGGSRMGAFCAVDLESEKVKQHEKIKDAPLKDRIENLKKTGMNIGPVFSFVRDNGNIEQRLKEISSGNPLTRFEDGTYEHLLWASHDSELAHELGTKEIYIADGHHRYNAMVQHHKELGQDDCKHRYGLFYIVPETQLALSAWHRVVDCGSDADFSWLFQQLQLEHDVYEVDNGYIPEGPRDIGMHFEGRSFQINPHPTRGRESLDILHEWILDPLMAIDEKEIRKGALTYIDGSTGPQGVISAQKTGRMIFTLPPTPLETVIYSAQNGQTMPPKSTNFSPKVPTGIVMRDIYR